MNESIEPVIVEDDENTDDISSRRIKWPAFVESSVAEFFIGFKLEKMSIEDGFGNKAKLSRTKEDEIKVEYSSITIL